MSVRGFFSVLVFLIQFSAFIFAGGCTFPFAIDCLLIDSNCDQLSGLVIFPGIFFSFITALPLIGYFKRGGFIRKFALFLIGAAEVLTLCLLLFSTLLLFKNVSGSVFTGEAITFLFLILIYFSILIWCTSPVMRALFEIVTKMHESVPSIIRKKCIYISMARSFSAALFFILFFVSAVCSAAIEKKSSGYGYYARQQAEGLLSNDFESVFRFGWLPTVICFGVMLVLHIVYKKVKGNVS